ncbi:hypothetical protein AAMO2058_001309900 [Amorphochlora amoebiformis]
MLAGHRLVLLALALGAISFTHGSSRYARPISVTNLAGKPFRFSTGRPKRPYGLGSQLSVGKDRYSTSEKSGKRLVPAKAIFGSGGPDSPVAKLKKIFEDYGAVALVFHSTVWSLTLATIYILVSHDLPIEEYLPAEFRGKIGGGAGNLAVSYLATETTGPVRTLLTLTVAPLLARRWRDFRGQGSHITEDIPEVTAIKDDSL